MRRKKALLPAFAIASQCVLSGIQESSLPRVFMQPCAEVAKGLPKLRHRGRVTNVRQQRSLSVAAEQPKSDVSWLWPSSLNVMSTIAWTSSPANAEPVTSAEWSAYFERVYFWQPLFGFLMMSGSLSLAFFKARRAGEIREQWSVKHKELQKLRVETLSGETPNEEVVTKVIYELEALQAEEVATRELIGFGEATPTSIRYALKLPRPDTPIARQMAAEEERAARVNAGTPLDKGAPSRPVIASETLEIVLVLVGTPLLVAILLNLSA